MQTIDFSLHTTVIPPVARRGQHTLVLLQHPNGKFLLGMKDFYPQDISRLLGGGMEAGEEPTSAAIREIHEEMGIELNEEQLDEIAEIRMNLTEDKDKKKKTTLFTTYLFFAKVKKSQLPYIPNDDIQAVAELTFTELQQLVQRFLDLPKEIEPGKEFSWGDYGQIYGRIHQVAIEYLETQNLIIV